MAGENEPPEYKYSSSTLERFFHALEVPKMSQVHRHKMTKMETFKPYNVTKKDHRKIYFLI